MTAHGLLKFCKNQAKSMEEKLISTTIIRPTPRRDCEGTASGLQAGIICAGCGAHSYFHISDCTFMKLESFCYDYQTDTRTTIVARLSPRKLTKSPELITHT